MCQCQGQSSSGASGSCGCGSKSCSCGCHKSDANSSCGSQNSCDYATKFLELADQAWMEVLKEKIKDQIRLNGRHLDDLAQIISEANHARWHRKMEGKKCSSGYEEKLRNFFTGSCSGKCDKS